MKKISNLFLYFVSVFFLVTVIMSTHAGAGESIANYKAKVKENPESVEVQCGLADAYINKYISTGKTKKSMIFRAKNAIKTAEKIDSKSPLPYITWAKYFIAMGEKETAVKRAQKAAALDPDNSEVQRLLEELGVKVADSRSTGTEQVINYPDGGRYIGDIVNGKRHGKGTMTWPEGRKYIGEWENDKVHGWGINTMPNGRKYEGEQDHDIPEGQGTLTYPNGNKYVGEFRDGAPSGGRYYWTDGRVTWSYVDVSSINGGWVHKESKP